MKKNAFLIVLFLIILLALTSGCSTTNPSTSGINLSYNIKYGNYYRYVYITFSNYSNLPFQATSITAKDLDSGVAISVPISGGDWINPGEVRTTDGESIPYYEHGSIKYTVCGQFSTGRNTCDSITITLWFFEYGNWLIVI